MMRGLLRRNVWFVALALTLFPPVAAAGWTYNSSTERMDNAVFRFASIYSSDIVKVSFPYKNHRPELTIRTKNAGNLNVLLEFEGQVQRGLDGGEVRVKFDSARPETWSFNMPADHGKIGLIFIKNEQAFLARLRRAKTVMIELPYYREGRQTFTFDVTGFDITKLGMKAAGPAKNATKK